jgi:ADP-heptose:LPS heptosyltransferase
VVPQVVVLRGLKLGDLLVAVPALRAIRRAWPHHEVVLATAGWLRPLVELAGCADTVVATTGLRPLPPHLARPEVAVNLHGAGPESHAVLDALEPARRIGHAGPGWPGPRWVDDLPERDRWCRLLRAHGTAADAGDFRLPKPDVPPPMPAAVVIHPGASHGSRRWPVDRFVEVARALLGDGHPVVVTGTRDERPLADRLAPYATAVLAGDTDLLRLAAQIARARLLISGDTGVAHLAYAFGTPSVTLFGPVPASRWGPPSHGPHRTLSVDSRRLGDAFTDRTDPALLAVTADEVLATARDLLAACG